ncbi:MAG: leucine-rich repeat protein [Clostridia bacterium]|nr:leucine-rich repeat protein [Clostridia bacterium]
MKKILSLLLAVMMLFGCIPAMAEEANPWTVNASTGMAKHSKSVDAIGHVTIPAEVDGVPVVGLDYMAFKSYFDMTQISFPDTLRFFGSSTLNGAPSMTEVTLPQELIIISDGSISDLPVENLVVPPAVSVVYGAFFNLPNIKNITFEGVCPEFPKDSYYITFDNLSADCVICVPDDQLDAYKAAFADREDVLARIQPSGKNAVVIDWTAPESDFEFDASTGTITAYNGSASRLEIPASIGGAAVKHIGAQAFLQRYSLMHVTIPEGVETVGKQAFHGCSLLTYVSLPTTLHTIGDSAFNTNNLVSVRWSEGLESIGSKAFYNCNLSYVTLPATLRTIADSGFENAGLVEVTFGPNVETVGEKGFAAKTIEAITYTGAAMPAFGADAFKGCKKDATLTLADGSPMELYDGFVTYMASAFPSCVVNEPAAMEMPFPALDVMAGMPFFGTWHDVAGMDVMGDFTDEYPTVTATLNPDATGTVVVDGEEQAIGWYVTEGYAIFCPVVNGKPDEASAFALASIDENGRMVVDFGYAAAITEQEGKLYTVPAIPEKPWPELDLSNAKSFIGSWQTTDGSMILTLNDDGTATSMEVGEDPYQLRWYAEYAEAFVGETVNTAASITFDGNGNIEMKMDGASILLVPYVEAKVIEGADELLGEWLDDIGNKLVLNNDGSMTYTYAFDGWMNENTWDVVDGVPTVIDGSWAACPITLENGILTITNGEGIFQIFSADGDLSAYYGEEEETYELPEAQPIGDEGAAYFGAWQCEFMPGMAMVLTLNQDGTCSMDMMSEVEPGVWTMENGRAYVMGDELFIDGDGNLVMESQGMVFVKTEAASTAGSEINEDDDMALLMAMLGAAEEGPEEAESDEMSDEEAFMMLMAMMGAMEEETVEETASEEMSDEEAMALLMAMMGAMEEEEEPADESSDSCIGVKFRMTGAIVQGMTLTADQLGCAGDYVIFNADGSAELVMGGINVQTLGWKRGTVNVLGTEYEDGFSIDYYGTYYNFAVTEEGLLMDYFGMLRTYERADGEAAPSAAAPAADPYVGKKFLCTGSIVQGMKLSAEQLGCAGDYVIFNADGSTELVMSGIQVQTLGWTRGTVNVAGVEYEGFAVDYYGTIYNFATTEDGLLLDYFGMVRTYEAE